MDGEGRAGDAARWHDVAEAGRLRAAAAFGHFCFRNFIVLFSCRDPGTLKSDIVSKKHPQLSCSDLRLSNRKFED